jgi:hypothetical protein
MNNNPFLQEGRAMLSPRTRAKNQAQKSKEVESYTAYVKDRGLRGANLKKSALPANLHSKETLALGKSAYDKASSLEQVDQKPVKKAESKKYEDSDEELVFENDPNAGNAEFSIREILRPRKLLHNEMISNDNALQEQ